MFMDLSTFHAMLQFHSASLFTVIFCVKTSVSLHIHDFGCYRKIPFPSGNKKSHAPVKNGTVFKTLEDKATKIELK